MKIRALVVLMAILAFAPGAAFSQGRQQDASRQTVTAGSPPPGLTPGAATAMKNHVEAYLRKIYAWGPAFDLKLGPITTGPAGFYSIAVEVSLHGQGDSALIYVSKDGRYLFRGDIQDMHTDPFAAVKSKLTLDGYASKGPANAKVVLVEFADFECPSCRELDGILRQVLPKYPQVRLVFKDFPLQRIHPWAMTAAIASHCVLQKGSAAFWKYHDAVYDNQDLITADNAYDKLTELAAAAGVNADDLHACMTNPAIRQVVENSIQQGKDLKVDSTPTTFVDGRRLVGPNQKLLVQYIEYDLHATSSGQ